MNVLWEALGEGSKWWWYGTKPIFLINLNHLEKTCDDHLFNTTKHRRIEKCPYCNINMEVVDYQWKTKSWTTRSSHWVKDHDWFPPQHWYNFVMNFDGCKDELCEICHPIFQNDNV